MEWKEALEMIKSHFDDGKCMAFYLKLNNYDVWDPHVVMTDTMGELVEAMLNEEGSSIVLTDQDKIKNDEKMYVAFIEKHKRTPWQAIAEGDYISLEIAIMEIELACGYLDNSLAF